MNEKIGQKELSRTAGIAMGHRLALLAGAIVVLLQSVLVAPAHAFGGEDLLLGPFHHEELSEAAAMDAGFDYLPQSKTTRGKGPTLKDQPAEDSFKAAETLAWHADYVDSYLYNPLWWAKSLGKTGLRRTKAALATTKDLERVHFDDLFDSEKVHYMWRRYVSGAFAGLMWAKSKNDVAAAQNIVGVSLHAMQDFYTHSNWIDKPERRNTTYFETPLDTRKSLALYTGAYEHEEHLGVKYHGKFMFECAVYNQPGVSQVMDIACGPFSPMNQDPMCESYRNCKKGISVQPKVGSVRAPKGLLYMQPGIAVDNSWAAPTGVKERGLTDLTGDEALKTALTLAERQSKLWLLLLGEKMKKAGAQAFWDQVMRANTPTEERYAQYEDYSKFPYQFLSTGEYPPTPTNREEYFVRVRIKTGDSMTAGTDADIKAMFDQGAKHLLDYSPGRDPVTGRNDFEKGSETVYAFGPFSSLPQNMTLYNESATTWDVVKATGKKIADTASLPFKSAWNLGKQIIGTEADYVGTNHRVFMPEELAQITDQEQMFRMPVEGGDEGTYYVTGYIKKTGDSGDIGAGSYAEYQVRLSKLMCERQSKNDRLSASDEPFVLMAASSLPGPLQSAKTAVFEKVKGRNNTKDPVKDSQRDIDYTFQTFRVPKDAGMVNVAVCVMESDDESEAKRNELRQKFVDQWHDAKEQESTWLETIGKAVAEDWQVGEIEVTAWTRNGDIKVGTIHNGKVNQWLKGGKSLLVTFNNMNGMRPTGVTTDELLPYIKPGENPASETPQTPPADPVDPSNPATVTPEQSALLDKFVGKWQANYGVLTLTREGNQLQGVYRRKNQYGIEGEGEHITLTALPDASAIQGNIVFGTQTLGLMRWVIGADGDTFSGTYDYKNTQDPHSGKRIKDATTPGTTGTPTTPTIPGLPGGPGTSTDPNNPNGSANPGTPGSAGTPAGQGSTDAGFRPLGEWEVKVDSIRIARGTDVEVLATYKYKGKLTASMTASDVNMLLTDSDGIGVRQIGNLYAPPKGNEAPPELLTRLQPLKADEQVQVCALFKLPAGATPLKQLNIFGYRCEPLTYNAPLQFTGSVPPVSFPVPGAVGSGAYTKMDPYEVRFDGVKRAGNKLWAIVTVKNPTATFQGHPTFSLNTTIVDANGNVIKTEGNLYRASGFNPTPKQINHSINIAPGMEATVAYPFTLPVGAVPKQFVIKYYGGINQTYALPAIP